MTTEDKKLAEEILVEFKNKKLIAENLSDFFILYFRDDVLKAMEFYHQVKLKQIAEQPEVTEMQIQEILLRYAGYDNENSIFEFTDKMLNKAIAEIKAVLKGEIKHNT